MQLFEATRGAKADEMTEEKVPPRFWCSFSRAESCEGPKKRCRGRDLNPRTPKGTGPEPVTFDQASLPLQKSACELKYGVGEAIYLLATLIVYVMRLSQYERKR